MVTSYSVVGQSIPREEGPDKVTGQSVYAADVQLPGILWGKVLRSPFRHAKILSIDTSRAKQVSGVFAVITGRDLPDQRVGRLLRDCPVLARERVLFVGEKVAAVAAETQEAAEEALLLIDVQYEELPSVLDPEEAMGDSAPVLHEDMLSYEGLPQPASQVKNVFAHNTWSKGDIEEGFREADLVFEHTFTTQLMHQSYIEPHSCVVDIDDDGRVQIWASNKGPFMMRQQLAKVWDIPEDRIRVNPCNIGGDFGGKGSFMDVPLCYHLALRSGRPVKMVMDYIEELMAGNPRHPGVITLKTGVTEDGKLVAREARTVFNSGAYGAFKPRVYLRGADHSGGPYLIPHVHIESFMVYTNNVPCGHMRAPAKPQVTFAVESHMDMIAHELGIDPYEFRLRNVLHNGDASPVGEKWKDIRAEETLHKATDAADWSKPTASPLTGRGMAITDQPPGSGMSSATVSMDETGKASLLMSLWDQGTGAHTILRQVVAETLTISIGDVVFEIRDTDAVPFESGPGGSRVTYTSGQSTLGAAIDLRDKLGSLAAEYLGSSADQMELKEGRFSPSGEPAKSITVKDVAARAVVAMQSHIDGSSTYAAPPSEYTSYCTQVAEVEVDRETGQVKVNKIVTAHDVGTVLNPIAHQGQVEGGVIQGLGYALMEEMETEDGRVSTLSFGDYKIPTINDIPELVTVLLEPSAGPGPFNSKGIGENSNTPVAAAIANAVFDAIGVRITDLPITAEKVLAALKGK